MQRGPWQFVWRLLCPNFLYLWVDHVVFCSQFSAIRNIRHCLFPFSFYLGGRVGDRQPWGARFCAMIWSHVTHIDNHCHLSWGSAGKAHRRKDGGQDPRDKQTPEIISFFCRICEHCISKLLVHLEDSKKFWTSRLVSKFLAHLP